MSIIRVEAQVSSEQLLAGIEQLAAPELDQLVAQVIALRARRQTPVLTRAESELLMKINQGVPIDLQRRYDELKTKRRDVTLMLEEHSELLRLTDQIEKLEAERLECLTELARIRHMSLPLLMKELGIQPPAYA